MSNLAAAKANVPAVVKRLMSYFDVSAAELARAFNVSRQAMALRLNGGTALKAEEVWGFSTYFGVPVEVMGLAPDDALRWVLDHIALVEERRVRPMSTWIMGGPALAHAAA